MRQARTYSAGLVCGGISGRNTGPHSLPLARIKKIMKKSSDDVKMISGEAPIVFAKACELFIEEITKRSWMVTVQGKRRTLHKDDVASAVVATDLFDFLVNLVDNSSNNHNNSADRASEDDQMESLDS
ncbi:putative ccaat-binding transcription factor [Tripterygium wilfordii]|uniref:Putative ccaat-binding transcription factor n=1 Tax=Tripterygium wilfordii TaxID=458696 RepID=A0A7J7C765_TRIWF|nr:nuclear transcription factor Y subunit C-4-like [Tripterygium wilfordii]KAF5729979.1 putative ccaat-binding transcription factor [Tripterygium wilfordii]